jgi:chemotaxis protein CheD
VPALVQRVVAAGGRRPRLEAALVGGASMFATTNAALEVGSRNEAAVREQLKALRIPVIATQTGGRRGRTIRVYVAGARVAVREAGGSDHDLVRSSGAVTSPPRSAEKTAATGEAA